MKKFTFRLERVLQYRKVVKGEKLRELTLANHRVWELEQQIESLLEAQVTNDPQGDGLSPEAVQLSGMYGKRVQEELIHARLALIQAEQTAAEKLEAYQEAAKDEEALVTLRDKKKTEYIEMHRREEMDFLDEVSIQRGNRISTE